MNIDAHFTDGIIDEVNESRLDLHIRNIHHWLSNIIEVERSWECII